MTIVGRTGIRMLAPMFVVGGLDAVRNPAPKAWKAASVTDPLESALGLDVSTLTLVRLNGAVQIAAGAALASGLFTRLAAAALVASLIPTTLAGHRFWEETDAKARASQRVQFLKNLAMAGGLALVIADTD